MDIPIKTFAESFASGLGSIIILVVFVSIMLTFLAYFAYERANMKDESNYPSLKGFYISTFVTVLYIFASIWIVNISNMESFEKAEMITITAGVVDDSLKTGHITVNDVEMDMVEPFNVKTGNELTVAVYEAHRAFAPLPIEKHTIIELRNTPPAHIADSK